MSQDQVDQGDHDRTQQSYAEGELEAFSLCNHDHRPTRIINEGFLMCYFMHFDPISSRI